MLFAVPLFQLALERETGVINGNYSDDMLFLRQLVLDGQWDAVLDFVEPLLGLDGFDERRFRYLVIKYKYYELLCIKQEPGPLQDAECTLEEIVHVLKELEDLAPTAEDYRNLCLLLTLPRLSDNIEFKRWNPSAARVECFQALVPLVARFLETPSSGTGTPERGTKSIARRSASNQDRMVQLLVKGVFYEACVEYCKNKAVGNVGNAQVPGVLLSQLLLPEERCSLMDADLSLICWLEVLPDQIFTQPFEQKSLSVKFHHLQRPSLEAYWTDHILQEPIKPKGTFPHSAVPGDVQTRFKGKLMSRSLLPGAEFGAHSDITPTAISRSMIVHARRGGSMSRSMAPGFHLTARSVSQSGVMDKSLDHVFEAPEAQLSRGASIDMSEIPSSAPRPSPAPFAVHEPSPGPPPVNLRPHAFAIPLDNSMTGQHLSPVMEMSIHDQLDEIKRRSGVFDEIPVFEQPNEPEDPGPQDYTACPPSAKLYQSFRSKAAQQQLQRSQFNGFNYANASLPDNMMNASIHDAPETMRGRPYSGVEATGTPHVQGRQRPMSSTPAELNRGDMFRDLPEVTPIPPRNQNYMVRLIALSLIATYFYLFLVAE